MDRRTFLRRGIALTGGLTISGPLLALASCTDARVETSGKRAITNMGSLSLPEGFRYEILSRQGETMSDGTLTPSMFDGMGAFRGPDGTTILIRNHENRGKGGEAAVGVAADKRYDDDDSYMGGCTKLVVSPERRVVESFAVLGGTTNNCAGGSMPWGSWISCEEKFDAGDPPHGYPYEVDVAAQGPVDPVPIRAAGRFVHEAVAWWGGVLYLTEDQREAALYRLMLDETPSAAGQLASASGELQALKITGEDYFAADTSSDWPVGQSFDVEWVTIDDPEPAEDDVRHQAHEKGAAVFDREEGAWAGDGRIYVACTNGGRAERGQVWELDPGAQRLRLLYESPGPEQLNHPDNIVAGPTGDLFICEDNDASVHVRRLARDGRIFEFAAANDSSAEFAGACFDPDGQTLFVNQQGDPANGIDAVTYAIWGPWDSL